MTSIQTQLWADRAGLAVEFYVAAFGASVLHQIGDGDDIVAQLSIDGAAFWVASSAPDSGRLSPVDIGGATSRVLLVVSDPDVVMSNAVAAGATEKSAVDEEHGWRIGRVVDPFGHEWELGRPSGVWPPGSLPA